jgi:hypothetical protein
VRRSEKIILVLDDDYAVRKAIGYQLIATGPNYVVVPAARCQEA